MGKGRKKLEAENEEIRRVVTSCEGRVVDAAELLGLTMKQLSYRLSTRAGLRDWWHRTKVKRKMAHAKARAARWAAKAILRQNGDLI